MPVQMHMFSPLISPAFKLYIIKNYQRLKKDENSRFSLNWNLNREISKLNYRIHTNAIKESLIPENLTKEQINYKYSSEADMLNVALFGMTAKEWREKNPRKKGNIRDDAAIHQLLILANMESYNAILIEQGIDQEKRMPLLRKLVVQQLKTLETLDVSGLPRIEQPD